MEIKYQPDPSHIPSIKDMWGEARNKVDSDEDAFYISFGHALHIISRLKLMPQSEADYVLYVLMEEQLNYMTNRYGPKPTESSDPYRIGSQYGREEQAASPNDSSSGGNEKRIQATKTTKAQPSTINLRSEIDDRTGQINRDQQSPSHPEERLPKNNP